MRLLDRLRHDVAERNIEISAVMLASAVLEHREDRRHRFLEHVLLGFHVTAERLKLGDGGALAHAEFAAAAAQKVEYRHTLGYPCWVIGGELENAVTEPDVFRPLARRRQKGL